MLNVEKKDKLSCPQNGRSQVGMSFPTPLGQKQHCHLDKGNRCARMTIADAVRPRVHEQERRSAKERRKYCGFHQTIFIWRRWQGSHNLHCESPTQKRSSRKQSLLGSLSHLSALTLETTRSLLLPLKLIKQVGKWWSSKQTVYKCTLALIVLVFLEDIHIWKLDTSTHWIGDPGARAWDNILFFLLHLKIETCNGHLLSIGKASRML